MLQARHFGGKFSSWARLGALLFAAMALPLAAHAQTLPDDYVNEAFCGGEADRLFAAVFLTNVRTLAQTTMQRAGDAWASDVPFFESWAVHQVRLFPVEVDRRAFRLRVLAGAEGRYWTRRGIGDDAVQHFAVQDEAPEDGLHATRLAAQCAVHDQRNPPQPGFAQEAKLLDAPKLVWRTGVWPFFYARHEQVCQLARSVDINCLSTLGDPRACGYEEQVATVEASQDLACDSDGTRWTCRQLRRDPWMPDLAPGVEVLLSSDGG